MVDDDSAVKVVAGVEGESELGPCDGAFEPELLELVHIPGKELDSSGDLVILP